MKNLFKNLMLVAVAAMAFTACQKDNEDVNRVNETTVVEFKAEFDTTRSGFGDKEGDKGYSSHWDGNEAIDLEVVSTNDGGVSYTSSTPKSDDVIMGEDGTFRAEFNGNIYNEGTITARIPAGSWETDNYTHEKVPSIPGTQTPEVGSVDPAAHILKAEKTFEGGMSKGYTLEFAHQVAYAKMNLNLGTVVAFAEIAQVAVEIDAQRYTLLPENLSEPTFWFACKAATPEAMTVTITDKSDKTYVKELDLAGASKKLVFTTGRVASFTVGGFEAKEIDYIKSISATYNQWQNRYEFAIYTNDGGCHRPYIYTTPDAKGLIPVDMHYSDKSVDGDLSYWLADAVRYEGYYYYTYTQMTVEQLATGYQIEFYLTDDTTEWTFTYSGLVSGVCNPPVPVAVEENVVATEISGNGNQYFTLNFTAGNYKFSNVWFDSKEAGKIIPEGNFTTSDTTIAYLNDEGNETGWVFAATAGTLNVVHDVENQEYDLTFTFTDSNSSTFTVTYTGKIEGIFSPGEATPLASPDGLQAVVSNYTTVTFSWNAVAGADSYEVYHEYYDYNSSSNVTSGHQTVTSTSVVFEGLEMDTQYNFYVKALPENEAINTPSESFAQTNTRTGFAISLFEAEVNVNYDSYTKVDSTYTFSNSNSNTLTIPFDPTYLNLAAGSYTDNWGWYYTGLTADFNNIRVDGSDYFTNVLALEVAIDGNIYTISIAGTLYSSKKTFKGVFTGEIALAEMEEITLVSATAADRLGSGTGEVLVTFHLEDSTTVMLAFKTGTSGEVNSEYQSLANMYIKPGEWGKWVSGLTEGYITNGWVNGTNTTNYSTVTVGYENNQYSFDFEMNNKIYTYTGAVANLTAPVM